MTNIAANTPLSATPGAGIPPLRSDLPADPASAAPNSGAPDDGLAESFAALLARQIVAVSPSAPTLLSSAIATDAVEQADSTDEEDSKIILTPDAQMLNTLMPNISIYLARVVAQTGPVHGERKADAAGLDTGLFQPHPAPLKASDAQLTAGLTLPLSVGAAVIAADNPLEHAVLAPFLAASTPPLPTTQFAVTQPTLDTPFGHSGWANEFSQKVSWMISQDYQIAELHLNPPDLGPLNVTLKISDNQATALFSSPHSAVREAITNALPGLRDMLADKGIVLVDATVGERSLGQNFSHDPPPRGRSAEELIQQKSATAAQQQLADDARQSGGAVAAIASRRYGIVDTYV